MSILTGLKVIDAATYIAGPCAATALRDFGAEVIKVEPPGGDAYRRLIDLPGTPQADVNYFWHLDNRGKRGIELDLSDATDMSVLHDLVRQADVFITNHPLPVRRKLALTHDDLSPLNPRLIYASMTGFGESGPEADLRGFDLSTYWARSGLMHVVRNDMEGPPAASVAGQGDHPTGIALFGAIMLALYERQTTGRGRMVHSSLIANGLWSNACVSQAALADATFAPRKPRHAPPSALVNTYRCRDGRWFIFAALQPDRDWQRLTLAVDRPEWADDPAYATMEKRGDNAEELVAKLDTIFATEDWPTWKARFAAVELQAGPVYDPFDAIEDPQARASGAIKATQGHPEMDQIIDSPMWLDGITKAPASAAPRLDEHGKAIRQALANGGDPWS